MAGPMVIMAGELLPGERVNGYTIVRMVAVGGQSIVYLAENGEGLPVIVKQLKDQDRYDQQLVARFLRDGHILQTLRHPHLAQVFDCLEHDGRYFTVQEYLSGGSLGDLIARGESYSEEEAIRWCCETLRALDYVHKKGIVHRDVKPSNLMLDDHRHVKIIDFGIARVFGEDRITRADSVIGTPWYMSPEQILTPGQVYHPTDVYSTGIVLYELLTGKVPFDGKTPIEVQININNRHPRPRLKKLGANVCPIKPDATSIDSTLEQIVLRAFERNPADRYGGCAEFERRLTDYLTGAPPPAFTWRVALGSLLVLSLLIGGALLARHFAGAESTKPSPPPDETFKPQAGAGLHVVKSVNPTTVSTAGTTVTYRYAVTSTGMPLKNVGVRDAGVTPMLVSGDSNGDGALNAGETWVYEARLTILQSHFDAGGIVASEAVAVAGDVSSPPHRGEVRLDVRPRLRVSALVNGQQSLTLLAPESVTYSYRVTNVGNVSLSRVQVNDRAPLIPRFRDGDVNSDGVLGPGESWRYEARATLTYTNVDAARTFVSRAVAVSDRVTSEAVSTTVTLDYPIRLAAPPPQITMVRPIYPPDAQLAGIKGIVVIELTLDPGGRVRDARVLRSVHPSLDRAALDAVKQWVYEPTLEHGVPVPVITNITVRFELG